MAKDNSWIGVLFSIALPLLIVSCAESQAEERESRQKAEMEAVYEEAYERGRQDAIEEIEAYINKYGEEAFNVFHVEFCCPNRYCQALISYGDGFPPYVVAYKGYDGWEDTRYSYIEFDY